MFYNLRHVSTKTLFWECGYNRVRVRKGKEKAHLVDSGALGTEPPVSAQESLLVVLRGPYVVSRKEQVYAACKRSALIFILAPASSNDHIHAEYTRDSQLSEEAGGRETRKDCWECR